MKKLSIGMYIFTRISIFIALVMLLVPLIWIFSLSLKLSHEVFESYLFLIPKHFTLRNYVTAVEYAEKYLNIGFPKMYLNSFIVTTATIILTIVIAPLGAFAFSNYRFFKGENFINALILATFMLPGQVLLIPLFIMYKKLHMLNTYLTVILPYTIFTIPISILVLRGFFNEIPRALKEAAKIDGASDFIYFFKIIIPMSKPAITTCIIWSFPVIWNEFSLALVFLGKAQLKTLPVGIANIGGGQYIVPYNIFAASMMICIIPTLIVFLIFQKWFMRATRGGAIKG